jgi:hypothetical protein
MISDSCTDVSKRLVHNIQYTKIAIANLGSNSWKINSKSTKKSNLNLNALFAMLTAQFVTFKPRLNAETKSIRNSRKK